MSTGTAVPGFYPCCALVLSALTPLAALSLRGGSTVVFYLFFLLSLAALAHHYVRRFDGVSLQCPLPILCALALPLASTLLTAWSVASLPGSELEKALRFLFALPLLVLLGMTPAAWLRHVQWGLMGGACAGAAIILFGAWSGHGRDLTSLGANYNAVTVSNLTLWLGMAGLLTLPWTLSAFPRAERAVKLMAFVLSVYAVHVSETRSSWMLLPVLALIVVGGMRLARRSRATMVLGCIALLTGAAVLIYFANPRFSNIARETIQFFNGNLENTSVSLRLQLWRASFEVFLDYPWLGAGSDNFRLSLWQLARQGLVTPYTAMYFGESHNDFLAALARNGIVGFLAMVSLYALPAWWFFRRMGSADPTMRVAAQLGLFLCLGYAAFSLTEMMFRNMRSVPLYSTLLVVLASLARDGMPANARILPAPRHAIERRPPPGNPSSRSLCLTH